MLTFVRLIKWEEHNMKAIFTLVALAIALTFTACTASDDAMDNTLDFNSVKAMYGLEETSMETAEERNVPSVTLEEMEGVLETLYSGSNLQKDCIMTSSEDKGESAFKVSMVSNYKTTTRTALSEKDFSLKVELRFSLEGGKVYYWGTDYSYSSDLFRWHADGLSLASVKGANHTYEFSSDTYLYFRVLDEGGCYVRVPLVFSGKYNFDSYKGTYSFQLFKYKK